MKLSAINVHVCRNLDFIVASIVFVCLILICFNRGIILSPDSQIFNRWADILLAENFNIVAYLGKNNYVSPPVFYLIPILLIAVFKLFLGDFWHQGFFVANLIFLGLAIFILVCLLRRAHVRMHLIVLILPLILLTDFQLWPSYILSDMLFSFLLILNIYLLSRCIYRSYLGAAIMFVSLTFLCFARPSGPISLILIGSSLVILYTLGLRSVIRLLFPSIAIIVVLTSLIFGCFFHGILEISEYGFYEFIGENEQLSFLASYVKDGVVVVGRPDTSIEMDLSVIEIGKLFLLRFLYFFMPIASTYSTIHNLANLLLISIFCVATCLWIYLTYHKSLFMKLSSDLCQLMYICSFIIFGLAWFHGWIFIDWDWRYRFPTILPMLILFATAVEQLLRTFSIGDNSNE